jgi:predicted porin
MKGFNFMMKKLLATAVLATMAATAHAQTSVYGLVDAYVGKNGGTVVDAGGMTTSYIGIRSSEDLGKGLKATAVLEQFLRPDTAQQGRFNGDTNWARNAYVSLANRAGEVQVGRVTTPHFVSTILFNPFVDSFTFSPIVKNRFGAANFDLAGGGVDTGWNNSVLAKTSMGGLSLTGVYSAGITSDAANSAGSAHSLGAMYFSGPLALTAVMQDVKMAGRADLKSSLFGASYDLKKVKGFVQLLKVENSDARTKEDSGYQYGVSVPMGKGTAMASYSKTESTFVDNRTADQARWAVGYSHALSKRTDVYSALSKVNYSNDGVNRTNAAFADAKVYGVGVRHRF